MLINKTEQVVSTVYNGITLSIESGGSLDVRDFKISSKDLDMVEKHIMKKNPGVFQWEKTKDIFETSKEYIKEIESLKKENIRLSGDFRELKDAYLSVKEELNIEKNSTDGYKEQIKSLKAQVTELKAKLKAAQ